MRGVALGHALQPALWMSQRSFFGRTARPPTYALSTTVARVDYFVSHAWDNDGKRKLSKLREYLCLQALLGRLLIILPTLAVFLVPLGFGINARAPVIPWWLPSALPLILLLLALGWIALSLLGAWPAASTPWALTPTLLWLDACCLCDDTPQTISAGVAGFERFLGQSDKMLALVSKAYFERLWTVYELATFCKAHRTNLKSRLLLLSLEWPSTWSPLKSAQLTAEERTQLTSFSCHEAQCYKPSDRADLLGKIRTEWGSEEEFDAFVHTELVEVLARSKEQYVRRLASVAGESLQLLLGD